MSVFSVLCCECVCLHSSRPAALHSPPTPSLIESSTQVSPVHVGTSPQVVRWLKGIFHLCAVIMACVAGHGCVWLDMAVCCCSSSSYLRV